MENLLQRVLELCAGSPVQDASVSFGAAHDNAAQFVFASAPSRRLRQQFLRSGFSNVYSFAAIPSATQARWILPTDSYSTLNAAARIYEPLKLPARVAKVALKRLLALRMAGLGGSTVLVGCKRRLSLSDLVMGATGEENAVFAFSLGRQAAVRKITVQVMRTNGEILGYIKAPLTPTAIGRVRNEAQSLQRLGSFSALRSHVPKLLYGGVWDNTQIAFQSPIDGHRGPIQLTTAHDLFLEKFWAAHVTQVPGSVVVAQVGSKWDQVANELGRQWPALGREALRRAHTALDRMMVRCGISHGDFAPWNTRVSENQLMLFDWESAAWGVPISWDVFHFKVQSSFFFRQPLHFGPILDEETAVMFMLYVLKTVIQFREENNYDAIERYQHLLLDTIERIQCSVSTTAPCAKSVCAP